MTTNNINLAGEFYAMHTLFRHGYVPTLTLGNTKGVDILVYNPTNQRQFTVEVKTSSVTKNEQHFGGENIGWRMGKKHEEIISDNLIYCFVFISANLTEKPRVFFVPSVEVAKYVFWEHEHWLHNVPHKKDVKDTDMRSFRILTTDFHQWEDNYELFDQFLVL